MNSQHATPIKNAHGLSITKQGKSCRDIGRCHSYLSGINATQNPLKYFKGKLRSWTELGKSCKNSISLRKPALKKSLDEFDFICAKKYLYKEESSDAKFS